MECMYLERKENWCVFCGGVDRVHCVAWLATIRVSTKRRNQRDDQRHLRGECESTFSISVFMTFFRERKEPKRASQFCLCGFLLAFASSHEHDLAWVCLSP